jgi:hypothetical protein
MLLAAHVRDDNTVDPVEQAAFRGAAEPEIVASQGGAARGAARHRSRRVDRRIGCLQESVPPDYRSPSQRRLAPA